MLISNRPQLLSIPPSWEPILQDFEIYLRSQGRSASTIDTRIRHLRTLARYCDPISPDAVDTDMLIMWSGSRNWKAETRNSYHASARIFFRWQAQKFEVSDPAAELKAVRRPVPPPRPAPDAAISQALINSDVRVQLILQLGAEMGLRCSEIAAVHREDVLEEPSGWGALIVHGKGGKERILPVPPALLNSMKKRFTVSPWLFPGQDSGHLSPRWVGKLAARALPDSWTLHTLRHRFATTAYAHCKDIVAIKEALGHDSIETTQRYTQTHLDFRGLITAARL